MLFLAVIIKSLLTCAYKAYKRRLTLANIFFLYISEAICCTPISIQFWQKELSHYHSEGFICPLREAKFLLFTNVIHEILTSPSLWIQAEQPGFLCNMFLEWITWIKGSFYMLSIHYTVAPLSLGSVNYWWRDPFMCDTVHVRSHNVKSHWNVQASNSTPE